MRSVVYSNFGDRDTDCGCCISDLEEKEMRKRKYKIRSFRCPECNKTMYASKNVGNMTASGHKKVMWCPYCKTFRGMIQIE